MGWDSLPLPRGRQSDCQSIGELGGAEGDLSFVFPKAAPRLKSRH